MQVLKLATVWITIISAAMYLMVISSVYFLNKSEYVKAANMDAKIRKYYDQNRLHSTETSCAFKPEYQTIIDSLFSDIK